MCALMRPTGAARGPRAVPAPVRQARKYCASPWRKNAFMRRLRKSRRSSLSGGTHCGWLACRRNGRSTKRLQIARAGDRSYLHAHSPGTLPDRRPRPRSNRPDATCRAPPAATGRLREGSRPRARRGPRRRRARPGSLPYFHVVTSPARGVVEMEGAERIMLGSNNYLGLTDDPRVIAGAQQRARASTGPASPARGCLNGTTPLHLELERELAEWMGTEAALVFTTGHQANLGTLGTILGARRHRDRGLRRPRLDPRRLRALAREAAALPPQPPGEAREDARARAGGRRRACSWSSTASSRWRATSRRCARSARSASATARG